MNSLVYLGYGIGGVELKMYPTKMEPIIKWLTPTSFIEVRIYFRQERYLWNFIESFSSIDAPLHTITTSGKSFQWGKNQYNAFN
jgi:hypothetical protein